MNRDMTKFKYRLEQFDFNKPAIYEGYTNFFPTAHYLLDVRMKNTIRAAFDHADKISLYIVIPEKGKICGWFITDDKNKFLDFKGRINYHHDNKVRWAAYQKTGYFKWFFESTQWCSLDFNRATAQKDEGICLKYQYK